MHFVHPVIRATQVENTENQKTIQASRVHAWRHLETRQHLRGCQSKHLKFTNQPAPPPTHTARPHVDEIGAATPVGNDGGVMIMLLAVTVLKGLAIPGNDVKTTLSVPAFHQINDCGITGSQSVQSVTTSKPLASSALPRHTPPRQGRCGFVQYIHSGANTPSILPAPHSPHKQKQHEAPYTRLHSRTGYRFRRPAGEALEVPLRQHVVIRLPGAPGRGQRVKRERLNVAMILPETPQCVWQGAPAACPGPAADADAAAAEQGPQVEQRPAQHPVRPDVTPSPCSYCV